MNREELYEWAKARDPYNYSDGEVYKDDIPETKLGIFDRILVELLCTIQEEWGLTERKAQRLWMLRSRFVELEEGDE